MRKVLFWSVLAILAGCNGGDGSAGGQACVTLQPGQLAGLDVEPAQVEIEARIVAVDTQFLDELGIDLPDTTPVLSDDGGALGGRSGQGRDVVVRSETVGGPANVPYLMTDGFDGLLALVNLNFASPFLGEDVKTFVGLPYPDECVDCEESATIAIQGFAGGADQGSLAAQDPMLAGTALYAILGNAALQALLDDLDDDPTQVLIEARIVQVLDSQRTVLGIQDVRPGIADLEAPFQTAVLSVVQNPLGMFTGFALDVTPTVQNGSVNLTVRPGTKLLSVFRSVPADVGGTPADVEIPFVSPGTNYLTVTVPDGQTVVIGGLQPAGQPEPTTGVPLLGKIPLIGSLFNHEKTDPEKQTLLIFITPRIVNPP
jgi:hypothetical protein